VAVFAKKCSRLPIRPRNGVEEEEEGAKNASKMLSGDAARRPSPRREVKGLSEEDPVRLSS